MSSIFATPADVLKQTGIAGLATAIIAVDYREAVRGKLQTSARSQTISVLDGR